MSHGPTTFAYARIALYCCSCRQPLIYDDLGCSTLRCLNADCPRYDIAYEMPQIQLRPAASP